MALDDVRRKNLEQHRTSDKKKACVIEKHRTFYKENKVLNYVEGKTQQRTLDIIN